MQKTRLLKIINPDIVPNQTILTIPALILSLIVPSFAQNYQDITATTLGFYAYQRAGIKGGDPHNPFYSKLPSPHANDGGGTDLSGGWYDAGDFVKFGLPLGFSVFALLKGFEEWPRAYQDKYGISHSSGPDGIPDILNEVKYATDYLLKAVVSKNRVVMDVGNGNQDHGSMGEDAYQNSSRTSGRAVYNADGADVPGLYAACLAQMAYLYNREKLDKAYADKCIAKAKEAFQFGLTHKKLSKPQPGPHDGAFYKSKAWEDKLGLGAIVLFKATKDSIYLKHAQSFASKVGSHYFAVGYGHVGDFLAYELVKQGIMATSKWMADVNIILKRQAIRPGTPALIKNAYVPSDWGNCGHAGNAALSLALAFNLGGSTAYYKFVKDQVHWLAGLAPSKKSFITRYNGGPTQPHHRNDIRYRKLKGAVVSGPTPNGAFDPNKPEASSWSYSDNSGNYKHNEPALDYNAGIVGASAFLWDYNNPEPGLIRIGTPLKAAISNLDLNEQSQTITGTLEISVNWKIILEGQTSKAVKTYSGSGKTINATWKGETDTGIFNAGEQITVRIDSDKIAPYHKSRAKTSFFLKSVILSDFKPTDKVLSDFNTTDIKTTTGGKWVSFSDKNSYTDPGVLSALNCITAKGNGNTKGLTVRLVGRAGEPRPYAGIKATFNAAGTPINLGNTASSIVFDIQPNSTSGQIVVELEQADITDGAYWQAPVVFSSDTWTRKRIAFSAFKQPDWKTKAVPINLGAISAIRFTYYGTSNIRFVLDNVRIDNMNITSISQIDLAGNNSVFTGFISNNNKLSYYFNSPFASKFDWNISLVNLKGKEVVKRNNTAASTNKKVVLSTLNLPAGIYLLKQRSIGAPFVYVQKVFIQ